MTFPVRDSLGVFPAGAGVIPLIFFLGLLALRVSRRRGGDPGFDLVACAQEECFPQARG